MSAILPGSKAEAVYMAIARRSPQTAERFRTQFSATVFDRCGMGELELLNAFWRDQLASLSVATFTERECLCASNDFAAWLANFENYVLPTIVCNW